MRERQRGAERPVEGLRELVLDDGAHGDADPTAENARLHEGADHRHEDQDRSGDEAGRGQRQQDLE
jgi:hypothetical protein